MRSSVFRRSIRLLPIAAALVSAQTNPSVELRGELREEGNSRRNIELRVELHDAHGVLAAAVPALPDGRFTVSGIAAGDYELVALSGDGREIARQHVSARDFASGLIVNIPGESGASGEKAPGGVVSVNALRHRPDRRAVSLQKKAIAAHLRNDHARSVELLRQALARDPLFASAHYLLGLEDAHNGDFASSAKELLRAVDLDGSSAAAEGACAVALLNLHEVERARVHAARAVQLDPRSPK